MQSGAAQRLGEPPRPTSFYILHFTLHISHLTFSCALFALFTLSAGAAETLSSPSGDVSVSFESSDDGMFWSLSRKGAELIRRSRMGLDFAGASRFGEMRIEAKEGRSADSVWTNRLYRRICVRDRYNEMSLSLEEKAKPHRRLGIVFRAYDAGVAFRYVVRGEKVRGEQEGIPGFQLRGELTEWAFPEDCEGWFTAYGSFETSQEAKFARRRMSSIGKDELLGMPAIVSVSGQRVALCEADLTNWAGMFYRSIRQDDGRYALRAALSPLPPSTACTKDVAVIRRTPAQSPWRVVVCGDGELDLMAASDMILNLNPPPEEGLDFSWVRPGASSWDWWVDSNNSLSTGRTMALVDFAAEMGWQYHTIDGGWYGWARRPNHGPDVRVECRKGFDLPGIVAHAASKGIGIWVWLHWEALDDNGVDETLASLARMGVKGVKVDFMNRQDQKMVLWYEKVARSAARHRLMVNFHGAYKPTGMERTWPNVITREGVLGNEMNKFSCSADPVHAATLPFTRFLLGPGDFTPGSFANRFSAEFVPQTKRGHRYGDETDLRPIWAEEMGTRAHAIALAVAYDSPLATLCDGPERYRGAKGVEALRALPTVWRETKPLGGETGSHYEVLRETIDGRFYFAALTVKGRTVTLPLSFLPDGNWTMRSFCDDPSATPKDAKAIDCLTRAVTKDDNAEFRLVDEGGAVAIFERTR